MGIANYPLLAGIGMATAELTHGKYISWTQEGQRFEREPVDFSQEIRK